MSKNPRDQINKASWTLMEGIKDVLSANLTAAVSQKTVDIKPEEFAKLLTIVNASVEQGYHRAARTFDKVVDVALTQAEMHPLGPQLTKKK